ncbi:MAG TPA: thiamine phosphate synthase [Candidatus Aquilonibacter sp.]|nr:thiamine phosphate synthase [Candidatus Aquilonibacter sp.]
MADRCFLYYITDRAAFPGDEFSRRRCLLGRIGEAARWGVDFIQLREKDLPTRELEALAYEVVAAVRDGNKLATGNRKPRTALLINSRTDVAMAVDADGVHLRSDDVSPEEVRKVWKRGMHVADEPSRTDPLIAVSCHSPAEVAQAAINGANFAVFAPIFQKKDSASHPAGLAALEEACRAKIPVLALGGVTLENARSCVDAGAAGVAGIRLFQENDFAEVVRRLR